MPDIVRLRSAYGHPVEVDHVPNPDPTHEGIHPGDVVEVRGHLVDEAGYREALGLVTDPSLPGFTPLPPDVAGYHWIVETSGQLRGWPAEKWDLVTEAASTVDTKAKGK